MTVKRILHQRIAVSFGVLLVIASCSSSSSEKPQSVDSVQRTGTTTTLVESTTAPSTNVLASTTTIAVNSKLPPVPDDAPLPPTSDIKDLSLKLTPVADVPLALGMAWSEEQGFFYIITQKGEVYRSSSDFSSLELAIDLTSLVSPYSFESERGMTGVAISPIDGRLFLTYNDLNKDTNVVSYDFQNGFPDPLTRRLVLFVEQPGVSHKAGNLVFDDNGVLFISLGDGGGNKGATAQDYTSLLGSILRIIPNIDGDGYTIPPDNPFVNDPFRAPEIYVKGLRQPHRFAYNRANGDIYITDVGEGTYEELNFLPAGTSGVNFGWPFMEGLEKRKNGGEYEFTPPIYHFAHPTWIAIIAGFIYHGEKIPKMKGALLFGDMAGKLSLLGSDGVTVLNISESGNTLTSFAEGPDGELYSLSRNGGVKRIDPA